MTASVGSLPVIFVDILRQGYMSRKVENWAGWCALRIALRLGAFIMSAMSKGRGDQHPASESSLRTRRKRGVPSAVAADPNDAFVRAFADALRDILHAEMTPSV